MVPLPPNDDLKPVDYPGNPVQISSLPVKHMELHNCRLITMENIVNASEDDERAVVFVDEKNYVSSKKCSD